jgi:two-component system, cell cycle response regulator
MRQQTEPVDELSVLSETRARLIAEFPERCNAFDSLLRSDVIRTSVHRRAHRDAAHKLAGLAGTVGLPGVSRRARDLEGLLEVEPGPSGEAAALQNALDALRRAFATDLAAPPPEWAAVPRATANSAGARILVVEDDRDQRAIVVSILSAAGYDVSEAESSERAQELARAERPAVVVLDVGLPDVDGLELCRRFKADPELSSTPLVFLTSHNQTNHRLAGLALGADDYLTKPVDSRELLFRVQRLLQRQRRPETVAASVELSLADFRQAASKQLTHGDASLALVRTGTAYAAVRDHLLGELPRRDLLGRYDAGHLLVLMPGITAAAAVKRIGAAIEALQAAAIGDVHAGVAWSAVGGQIDTALAEADEALAGARYLRLPAALRNSGTSTSAPTAKLAPLVLLADDDPDVMRVVDAQVRAGGYRTVLAFDGSQALDLVRQHLPTVLVLDLMMPKLTGFEVLNQIRGVDQRPKTIVLSGRGREDDVTRAFELGADDYVTKPFQPRELLARVGRLLR